MTWESQQNPLFYLVIWDRSVSFKQLGSGDSFRLLDAAAHASLRFSSRSVLFFNLVCVPSVNVNVKKIVNLKEKLLKIIVRYLNKRHLLLTFIWT